MLFPPILSNSQPAFDANVQHYPIYFSLPSTMSLDSVKHIQIKLTLQSNNKSAVDNSIYPDGIIYKDVSAITKEDDGSLYVSIDFSDLLEKMWKRGQLYKVQLAFGSESLWTSKKDFVSWKNTQVSEGNFSDWSTVMIIKPITPIGTTILNALNKNVSQKVLLNIFIENTTTPVFMGQPHITDGEKEVVDKYKFILYSVNNKTNEATKIEDTGWLQHKGGGAQTDSHVFKRALLNDRKYKVEYQIVSNNNYVSPIASYTFSVYVNQLKREDAPVQIYTVDDDIECLENGYVKIYLNAPQLVTGHYAILRTDEKSNFQVREDIKYLNFLNQDVHNQLCHIDYNLEDNVKYSYAIQKENINGFRTPMEIEVGQPERSVNLNYSYLYREGAQLKLKFNNKMSSYKKTILISKADTLGSKYPTISKNGDAYYSEFPVTGLISLKMDEELGFLNIQKFVIDQGNEPINRNYYCYRDEPLFPVETYLYEKEKENIEKEVISAFETDLTDQTIYQERKFREAVISFLNDGEYKLYRSATEGNMLVVLTNVSLTPNQTLGRAVYEFSATAYEVADYTVENLNKYGVINRGELSGFTVDDGKKLFGQIAGIFQGKKDYDSTTNTITDAASIAPAQDIYKLIEEQIAKTIEGEQYKYKLNNIISLKLETYPEEKINDLYQDLLNKEYDQVITEEESKQLVVLKKYIASGVKTSNIITVLINESTPVRFMKNRVMYLENQNINSIKLEYTAPIIVNYTCSVVAEEDYTQTTNQTETYVAFGQLNGLFTTSPQELQTYNPNYADYAGLQVPYDGEGSLKYNVFKTTNILEVIKEQVRKQVEKAYDYSAADEIFTLIDPEKEIYQNKKGVYYYFDELLYLAIEGETGTMLKITTYNAVDKLYSTQKIFIGPTQKYILAGNNSQSVLGILPAFITDISLEDKSGMLIVDYIAKTTQETKKAEEEEKPENPEVNENV